MTTVNSVNTYIVPTTANEVTMPSQPAFLAYNSVTDAGVTGNGTVYTVVCDTEVYDRNADYNNGTGVFTAPVTGRYQLNAAVLIETIVNSTTFNIQIVTSNRTYSSFFGRPALAEGLAMQLTCLADMDAADTAHITIQATGEGADNNDVYGGAVAATYFCGILIC